jgi:hypothetical protein
MHAYQDPRTQAQCRGQKGLALHDLEGFVAKQLGAENINTNHGRSKDAS